MQKQHRFLSFVLVALALFALAQPIALMAQTEPTPTLAQAASTPDAAVSTPDPAAPPVPRVHVVVEGENLTTIAADYGVTVEDILAINNLANGDFLQLGQELIIPGGTGEAIATVYAIGAGDTLAEVAAIFNTTLADVVATNRVIATELPLIVGQTVPVVSRTGSATPRPATGRPYLVAAGDTLLTVAAAHKLTPAALAAANGLSGLTLFPGQRLRIPDETAVYRHLPEGWLDVRVSPTNPGQGSTVAVTVANLLPGTPAGRLGDQPLHFAPAAGGYVALVGLDAFAEPGLYDLEISGGDERGLWQPLRVRLPVTATAYDTQYVTVGEALDGLLDPAVRATEDEFLHGIFAVFDETQHWEGVFQYPVTTTVISAGYGGRRSYNDGPIEIYHTGLDIAAPQGQTVSAPAAGVVAFSDVVELRGGIIILDHGRGVMTGYYHLSERLVNAGDAVAAGQPIGRVGSTGLSSGAHLHWDLRIMGVPVDPLPWTQRTFP
jgi:murein DD-endopeptidase MepM/ murein hydrolase activator NlpD